jgi:hypothetical protein
MRAPIDGHAHFKQVDTDLDQLSLNRRTGANDAPVQGQSVILPCQNHYVSPSTSPSALEITVAQTLALLDGPFRTMSEMVARGQFVLWLGSGISRGRVADLTAIISGILQFLQDNIESSNSECPYLVALQQAVNCSGIPVAMKDSINYEVPVQEWRCLAELLEGLINRYASLLDIRIDGTSNDSLVWKAVGIVQSSESNDFDPDCEHLCIALLIIEGVLPNIATANWDGLIEQAVSTISKNGENLLRVCVEPDDFTLPPLRSRLIKFHGCAVRAEVNESQYRKFLIGNETQILSWPDPHHVVMSQHLTSLLTSNRTLMIGLSAQDSDIQRMYRDALEMFHWPWPSDSPAFVFAEDALGVQQKLILKLAYDEYYENEGSAIEKASLLRTYAKALLVALVLRTYSEKLCAFIEFGLPPGFDSNDQAGLKKGITRLRDQISTSADGDRQAFVLSFIREFKRCMYLCQTGGGDRDTDPYRPLSATPIHQFPTDPWIKSSGISELAIALAILSLGSAEDEWELRGVHDIEDRLRCAFEISTPSMASRVYFASNPESALRHLSNEVFDETDPEVIFVLSHNVPHELKRSPAGAPGRIGKPGCRIVEMPVVLGEAPDLKSLRLAFRQAAYL